MWFSYKCVIAAICLFLCSYRAKAYSILTHEAIIDACWDSSIRPLLLQKYPGSSEDQLHEAHAYAYGGAVIPDMGYYPFGSKLFTNLLHYVRSGDFVKTMMDEATNINEYAFALGTMCHYYADKYGHPLGTNRCVPIMYTKDKNKFGADVTYEQDPMAHIRMEFGFDVLQTARGNYVTERYHDFIGFKISQPVLERAFLKTYGLDIHDVFNDLPLAIETFRWIIKDLFPTITRAAWASKKKDIIHSQPGITRRKFEYKMRRANYYHEFGKRHEKPGVGPWVLAKVVYILPKVGPLRALKIKIPGPEAEKIFIQSFDTVQAHYTLALQTVGHRKVHLENIDFDTGKPTMAGEYTLADEAYIDLLLKLEGENFSRSDNSLKQNILKYYEGCNEKMAAMAGTDKWQRVTHAIDSLRPMLK